MPDYKSAILFDHVTDFIKCAEMPLQLINCLSQTNQNIARREPIQGSNGFMSPLEKPCATKNQLFYLFFSQLIEIWIP